MISRSSSHAQLATEDKWARAAFPPPERPAAAPKVAQPPHRQPPPPPAAPPRDSLQQEATRSYVKHMSRVWKQLADIRVAPSHRAAPILPPREGERGLPRYKLEYVAPKTDALAIARMQRLTV